MVTYFWNAYAKYVVCRKATGNPPMSYNAWSINAEKFITMQDLIPASGSLFRVMRLRVQSQANRVR